jgi:acetolactate synthase-1/2/3 large subunit
VNSAKTTTGQFFADTLKGYGVSHVFYVPDFFDTSHAPLSAAGITQVMAHHEVAAAYMADGYARGGRKPGVCMAQQVGAANMAAGLRDAFLASVPLICLTGGTLPDSHYRHEYQMIEDFDMFRPVTKFNAKIEKPVRMADLLRQAFREATSGTPGPVHLELPGRVGDVGEGEFEAEVVVEPQFTRVPPYRAPAEEAYISEAARVLSAAERPVIVAGGGVVASGAEAEVVALAERLSIPVAASFTGKDVIPDDHPLSLGVTGSYGRPSVKQTVKEADLVFFIGSRAGDQTSDHYTTPPQGTTVIQLDINPAEPGRIYPARVALVGDAKLTLQRLVELATPNADTSAWLGHVQKLRDEWFASVEAACSSDATPIRPERLCREISEFLPENGVVVADTGQAGCWTAQYVRLTRPGQRHIRCFGTLGWAHAGALGVKCAVPDSTIVSFIGDAGMYYTIGELETAARFNIPTITVVNNNSAFGMVQGVLPLFGFDLSTMGDPREIYAFEAIDFAQVANGMGCLGIRVESPDQIRPALEQAQSSGRPSVIDVVTSPEVMPSWSLEKPGGLR